MNNELNTPSVSVISKIREFIKRKPFIITSIIIGVILLVFIIILIIVEIDRQETIRLDAESVVLQENLTVPYGQETHVSDFLAELKGELVEDKLINTNTLGTQEITFEYINLKNKKRPAQFFINVADVTAPKIYGNSSYSVPVNYTGDLTNLMLSGDDLDDQPVREVIGTYDLSQTGIYHLTYQITDAYQNRTTQDFTLNVYQPTSGSTSPSVDSEKLPIAEAIKTYKTSQAQIGIDVSQWQGEIDWQKVQQSGVEFAMIRLGYQYEFEGEYILDPYFTANVEGAGAAGLPVGVYFYSYARTREQAQDQAEWILEQISPYQLELGVAFDWESWSEFNQADMSFTTINSVANTFLETLEQSGHTGILYSSKVYLDRIWDLDNHSVWLAQYYHTPTYEGEFDMWQFSSSGRVSGIYGDVDLNLKYQK